jgi:tripartite-type tricarboxylate transporter receptor subunit TctC
LRSSIRLMAQLRCSATEAHVATGDYPMVMVAHPSVPANTIAGFITYAKINPRKISMASFGSG